MKKQGFTMIELIVVVAIISLLCAAGMFSVSTMFSQRLDAEAHKLLADLYWARERAVSRHLDYIVDIDAGSDDYAIYEDRNGDGNMDADEQVKSQHLEVDITSSLQDLTFQPPLGEVLLNPSNADEIDLDYGTKKTRRLEINEETGYVGLIVL